MTKLEKEKLKLEIDHIFESGANELRIYEMAVRFIDGINGRDNNRFLPEINSDVINIIEIDCRNTYKFINEEKKCHKCGRIGGKHFAVCEGN